MSLQGRLVSLVLLAVLPALAIILHTATFETALHTEQIQKDALALAEATATRLDQHVEGIRQVLIAVGTLPEVQGDDADACTRRLVALLQQYPQYCNFAVAESNGIHFASAMPFSKGYTAADRSWFRQVTETHGFASGEYQVGRLTGKASINFAYPLNAADGTLRRVLYVALDLQWLNRQLIQGALPTGAVLTVFDRSGTILARSLEPDQWIGRSFPDTPLIQRVMTSPSGVAEMQGLAGVWRMYAYCDAGGATRAFHVAVGIPRSIALAHVRHKLRVDLLFLVGVTLLALAAAWYGGRAFVGRPVDALIRATDRLTGGDLGTRVALRERRNEFARLGKAFNAMAESLQKQSAERDQAMKALRASEAMLNETGRMARIGGWAIDLEQGTLTWTREVFAIHEVDATFRPTVDAAISFYAPESRDVIRRAVDDAVQHGRPFDVELELITARQRRIWVRAIGHARFDDGKPKVVSGTFQDITERKLADDELRKLRIGLEQRVLERTAQLEAANQELEAFSYSVSHDLRAPLRAVDGFSYALLQDCADQLDDEGRTHLQRIRAATKRMGQLIDDLLTLSRINQATLRRERMDLSALAHSVCDELREAHPERQVNCEVEAHLEAHADANLMRIVLENLLGNAWKFTAKTALAHLAFGRATRDSALALVPPGAVLPELPDEVFYVRDNGAGFDMAYASKLFGAFQRLHRSDEFPGTGIGLATVARIIRRHGGGIRAAASPGAGAVFFFWLESTTGGLPG